MGIFGESFTGYAVVAVGVMFIAWLWLLFERPGAAIQIASNVFGLLWRVLSAVLTGIGRLLAWVTRRR